MPDGKEYVGRSYTDVVAAMSGDKLTEPRSIAGYRRSTARRVSDLFEVVIDTTDDRSFVRSLVAAGLVEWVS